MAEKMTLAPNQCKTLEDIPSLLRLQFESGEVPMDEPPGLPEHYYMAWKRLGGTLKAQDHTNLRQLGSNSTEYKYDQPSTNILEVFPNPQKNWPYSVYLTFGEFTSLCPKTGQPDFATIKISYFPRSVCVETKSLKLYLFAYRNRGSFMERIANEIHADLLNRLVDPYYLHVEADFNARGGIGLTVDCIYGDVPKNQGARR